jgi:hypothetical protein
MTWQPRELSGLGISQSGGTPGGGTQEHVIWNCEALQSGWQFSVPPCTPPSGRTVAPLLTSHACPVGPAMHPPLDELMLTSALSDS